MVTMRLLAMQVFLYQLRCKRLRVCVLRPQLSSLWRSYPMSGPRCIVPFTLSCYLLSGREILLDGLTKDNSAMHVSIRIAKALSLNRKVHQVFLVRGVHLVPPDDTLRDCGITELAVRPFLNVVVALAPPLSSAELWHIAKRTYCEDHGSLVATSDRLVPRIVDHQTKDFRHGSGACKT